MPRFYPQNLKHLQQYHRPDREQTENGKISIFRCVLHRSSQNSLFGQGAGPFQEIILQLHREQYLTETHRKITPSRKEILCSAFLVVVIIRVTLIVVFK